MATRCTKWRAGGGGGPGRLEVVRGGVIHRGRGRASGGGVVAGKIGRVDKLDDEIRELVRGALRDPVRHRELRDLGLNDHDIKRLLRRQALQRSHGRYLDGAVDGRVAAARTALAAHPRSVVSHFTAAHITDLRVWNDSPRLTGTADDAVWLTCVPGRRRRNLKRTDLVLRRAGLTAADLQLHNGLLLTSDARTTVDLARELPLCEAVVTVDHALTGSVSRAELEFVLARQKRWPGVQRARRAVAFGDPRAESALESFARARFAEAGLPAPVLQVQFWNGVRWSVERVDFWWPEFRTVAEADGLGKFEASTPEESRWLLRRFFDRDHRLAEHDLELVHFGWTDAVRDPAELGARLRAAFARGGRRTGPEPVWRTTYPNSLAAWPHTADCRDQPA